MAASGPIAFRRSRLAFASLLCLAVTALLSLAVVPMPLLGQAVVAIGIVAIFILAIRRHALLSSSRSIIAIQPLSAGICIVKNASGGETEMSILPDSVIWPWMLLLRVTEDGSRWPVEILVLRDSVVDEDWRRLSIWLRWQASADAV